MSIEFINSEDFLFITKEHKIKLNLTNIINEHFIFLKSKRKEYKRKLGLIAFKNYKKNKDVKQEIDNYKYDISTENLYEVLNIDSEYPIDEPELHNLECYKCNNRWEYKCTGCSTRNNHITKIISNNLLNIKNVDKVIENIDALKKDVEKQNNIVSDILENNDILLKSKNNEKNENILLKNKIKEYEKKFYEMQRNNDDEITILKKQNIIDNLTIYSEDDPRITKTNKDFLNLNKYFEKKWFGFTLNDSFSIALKYLNIDEKILEIKESDLYDYDLNNLKNLYSILNKLCIYFNSNVLLSVINRMAKKYNNKEKPTNFYEQFFWNFGFLYNINEENVLENINQFIECAYYLQNQLCILNNKKTKKLKACSYTVYNLYKKIINNKKQ